MKTMGVLLAGGASSRMGHDKALLTWRDSTLLDRQMDLLTSLGLDRVLVAGKRPGHDHIEDMMPHAGPLAALANVVESLPLATRIVAIAVDMPLLEREHLAPLVACTHSLVAYEGHPLPLGLTITQDTKDILRTRLRRGQKSLRGLWEDVTDAVWLAPPEGDFLLNTNTPEEWQAFINRRSTT